MRKVCRPIQSIHIPTKLAVDLVARSLLTVNTVLRERSRQPLPNQRLAGAVSLSNHIDVALVFGCDTPLIEAAQQCSRFSRDAFCYLCKFKLHSGKLLPSHPIRM